MTRRVYCWASCIAAADLAAQLGEGFEVVSGEAEIFAQPGVIVVDRDRALPVLDQTRVIRLVPEGAAPPADGDLVLPASVTAGVLAHWIRRAFSELDPGAEVRRLNR